MENDEIKSRDIIYKGLIEEYKMEAEKSILYERYWIRDMKTLLKEIAEKLSKELGESQESEESKKSKSAKKKIPKVELPEIKPENEREMIKWLSDVMKNHPEWKPKWNPSEAKKGGFWDDLWLMDACYEGKLITGTEYYEWLVKYFEEHPKFYQGLGIKNIKKDIRNNLRMLAKLLQGEQDEKRAEQVRNHLLRLTHELRKMALHRTIYNWCGNIGYSVDFEPGGEITRKKTGSRKQDFSTQLFEAYIDRNYDLEGGFARKDAEFHESQGIWHLEEEFCMVDKNLAKELWEKVREAKIDTIYVPLAIHVPTGCVFFLAGKKNYEKIYDDELAEQTEDTTKLKAAKAKLRKDYQNAKGCCCFDYLRLVNEYGKKYHGDIGGALQMRWFFDDNVTKDYEDVLNEFIRYCSTIQKEKDEIDDYLEDDSYKPKPKAILKEVEDYIQELRESRQDRKGPLNAIKHWNEEMVSGIPTAFLRVFDGQEDMED